MRNASTFRTQHTADFDINESEQTTDDLQKERKFIVFESCFLSLFPTVMNIAAESYYYLQLSFFLG